MEQGGAAQQKLTRTEFALMALDEMLGYPNLGKLAQAIQDGEALFDGSRVDAEARVGRAMKLQAQLSDDLVKEMAGVVERLAGR